jgi:hypothetical protein
MTDQMAAYHLTWFLPCKRKTPPETQRCLYDD